MLTFELSLLSLYFIGTVQYCCWSSKLSGGVSNQSFRYLRSRNVTKKEAVLIHPPLYHQKYLNHPPAFHQPKTPSNTPHLFLFHTAFNFKPSASLETMGPLSQLNLLLLQESQSDIQQILLYCTQYVCRLFLYCIALY
jgi:hypothetical protein